MGKAALFAVVMLIGCGVDSVEVDRRHCKQLRDHIVDLRVSTLPKGVNANAHRGALKQALGDSFIDSCERDLSVAQLQCGLNARDFASATACSTKK